MGIITVNSDYEKLFGEIEVTKLSLIDVDTSFDNYDAVATGLIDFGVSEEDAEYVITITKTVLGNSNYDDAWLLLSKDAVTALANTFADLEADGETLPFTITEDDTFTNEYLPKYEWSITLDGSGGYSDDFIFAFLGKVCHFFEDMCYPELVMALYEGLVSKQAAEGDITVTFNLPIKTWSVSISKAINSALTELDEEGEDISKLFDNGEFDDDTLE